MMLSLHYTMTLCHDIIMLHYNDIILCYAYIITLYYDVIHYAHTIIL